MQYRLERSDESVPTLGPGEHAYLIRDERDCVLGVVASSLTPSGTQWVAARIMPGRTRRWGPGVWGRTRKAAVEALIR